MTISSNLSTIEVEQKEHSLSITLANPKMRNRLASNEISELISIFEQVNDEQSIRVLTITGSGDCFCAGFDFAELSGLAAQGRLPDFDLLCDAIENLRCPSIAVLNGGAYGGAIELALACDFRLAVDNCEIMMPAAGIGLHYYPRGIRRYVAKLGVATSKQLLLAGKKLTGQQLLNHAFVDELVEPASLAGTTNEWISLLVKKAPLALEGMKRCIDFYSKSDTDDGNLYENFRTVLQSTDFKEGIAALSEKRSPTFKRQ